MGLYRLRGDGMAEKETLISIRMGSEEIQRMEGLMFDLGIDSRSRFIRDAIDLYVASKGKANVNAEESGIFVRFKEIHMEAIRLMVEDGTAGLDEEDYVRRCTLTKLITPEAEADSADRAFKAAQLSSKMK